MFNAPPVPDFKYLYHTTEDKYVEGILKKGLKIDDFGLVYLAEKPLAGDKYPTFKVRIPDHNQLMDWREAWYDDDGEELDIDHQYEENNPYYLYLTSIPPEYLELVE